MRGQASGRLPFRTLSRVVEAVGFCGLDSTQTAERLQRDRRETPERPQRDYTRQFHTGLTSLSGSLMERSVQVGDRTLFPLQETNRQALMTTDRNY